jgi:V8-like Glu-specific endopeptidase
MYYWLFDYNMPTSGAFNPRFHKNNYVSCKRIVKRVLDPTTHNDYALIELKSAVTNRKPLPFRRSGQINIGEPLVVIGHPSGLPTKIADGAEVKAINETFLTANLDTFGGNDGSPVINVNTGLVEGILVRGAEDYEIDSENNCKKAARLPNEAAVESATLVLGIKELQAL